MTSKAQTIEHQEPASLPSQHIDHSANFANELDARLLGFQSALMAVEADMEGMQAKYEKDAAEAAQKHSTEMASRERLKRDINRSKAMAEAARAVYAQDIPVTEKEGE